MKTSIGLTPVFIITKIHSTNLMKRGKSGNIERERERRVREEMQEKENKKRNKQKKKQRNKERNK